MRGISNKLCAAQGLSVIVNGVAKNSKSYYEWMDKDGVSWKAKLQKNIDEVVLEAKDFEDFLRRMEDRDYEWKRRGQALSFRYIDQQRFTRLDTLGLKYQEEKIIQNIEAAKKNRALREQLKNAQPLRKYTAEDYLQRLADVVSYLEVNNINSLDDLRDQAIDVSDEMSKINDDLRVSTSRSKCCKTCHPWWRFIRASCQSEMDIKRLS